MRCPICNITSGESVCDKCRTKALTWKGAAGDIYRQKVRDAERQPVKVDDDLLEFELLLRNEFERWCASS